jgi:parvulin-like peptidyl-prolyl isomerase
VGSVSDIIETHRGYVIIRVLDRQEQSSATLEVLEEDVTEEIYQEKMRERYEQWMEELYQEAYIEVKL